MPDLVLPPEFNAPAAPPRAAEFGPFRLVGPLGPLLKNGEDLKLQPKTLSVLWLLVIHAGDVVPKRKFLDALWPGMDVGDEVIAFQVARLREVLGDDSKRPTYIGTAHRVGFRFIAPVTALSSELAEHEPLLPDTVFVGREAELQQLRSAWAAARKGKGATVFITGEAGIGKSTLLEQLITQERLSRRVVAIGRCSESGAAVEPYLPVIGALGQWVRNQPDGTVVDLLRRLAPSWMRLLPGLLRPEEREQVDRQVGNARTERLQRELIEFLQEFVALEPRLLCFEDLHWADAPSVELIHRIAQTPFEGGLLLVSTLRPVDVILAEHPVRDVKRQLLARGAAREIPLEVLHGHEITAFIRETWSGTPFTTAAEQLIAAKSSGHPLFLSQIIDYLSRNPHEPLDAEALDQAVPERLAELVGVQMGHLGLSEQLVLESASLVGASFCSAAVASVSRLDEEVVEATLDRLATQGQFILSAGMEVWPDGTVSTAYRFRHALYEHLLRRRIEPGRRRRMHLALAQRLATAYAGRRADIAAALTGHFELAGQFREAVGWGLDVAHGAFLRGSSEAVIQQRDRCMALLGRLNPQPEDAALEFNMRLLAAGAIQVERGYWSPDASADLERMKAMLPAIRNTFLLERSLSLLLMHAYSSLRFADANRVADLMESYGRQYDGLHLQASAHAWRSHLLLTEGQPYESRQASELALQLAAENEGGLDTPLPWSSNHVAYMSNALALWTLGYPDQALQAAQLAVSAAHRTAGAVEVGMAYGVAVMLVQVHRGDWSEVITTGAIARQSAVRYGYIDAQLWIDRSLTIAQFHLDPGLERLAAVDTAIAAHRQRGGGISLVIPLTQYAECCLQLGELDQARKALAEARAYVEERKMKGWVTEVMRLEALLKHRSGGPVDEVVATLRAAVDHAHARQALGLSLRAALSLHEVQMAQGQHAEAMQALSPYVAQFDEGHSTRDVRRLLTALGWV